MTRRFVVLFAVAATLAACGAPSSRDETPATGQAGSAGTSATMAGRGGRSGTAGKAAGAPGATAGATAGTAGSTGAAGGSGSAGAATPILPDAGATDTAVMPKADAMTSADTGPSNDKRPHIIIDSDANNEVDDQHAIAYLLFNSDRWIVDGVTTNRTQNGGDIEKHTKEARFIVALCASDAFVKVYKGASGSYNEIKGNIGGDSFDGSEAVNFIIAQANKHTPEDKLLLAPVGKLTNIALALLKAPSIADKIRITWLGSSYPQAGEYNLENDNPSVNAVLSTNAEMDIITVRYGGSGGTFDVRLNFDPAAPDGKETRMMLPGLGPKVAPIVSELHGGKSYTCFGDYSLDLLDATGETSRPLFDMAAIAIIKNPAWASPVTIGAPLLRGDNSWEARPNNARKVRYFQNFNQKAILDDFFKMLRTPKLPN